MAISIVLFYSRLQIVFLYCMCFSMERPWVWHRLVSPSTTTTRADPGQAWQGMRSRCKERLQALSMCRRRINMCPIVRHRIFETADCLQLPCFSKRGRRPVMPVRVSPIVCNVVREQRGSKVKSSASPQSKSSDYFAALRSLWSHGLELRPMGFQRDACEEGQPQP